MDDQLMRSRERAALEALARVLLPSGHGLPGADDVDLAQRFDDRSRSWGRSTRSRIRWLVRAWEWSPLFSRHLSTYSRLDPIAQGQWLRRCYRSRIALKRLQVAALRQLLLLEWASTDEVESAIGYDYRCRKDDVPRGTDRAIVGHPRIDERSDEPPDYYRRGPAIEHGAVPQHLLAKRDFRPTTAADTALETASWPHIGGRERADVVVVGSGAGGAVVATTLAESGADVLVVEEGPQVGIEDFEGAMFDRFQRFCRDNGFTQVLGNPPIPLPLGKVVGGTTVINSGTCFRAPGRVLARWEQEFGLEGATSDGMATYYERVEEALNVRPVPWELLGPNGMAAHRGAVALGYSGGPLLRNISDCHGCGQCAFGCPTDAKQAMHISYLPRAARAGARIYSRCRAEAILTDNGRAVGVRASLLDDRGRRRGDLTVEARAVVVCAGAVHTPALLQASGIPDPSGQTGRNLRIHPATGVGGFFEGDVVNWKGTLQSYYIDQFFDTHELMFEATTTIPSIGAGSVAGVGVEAMEDLAALRRLATLGFYVSDTSRGRVRRLPNGEVVASYRMNEVDARRMAIGIAVASEVLLEAGATRVYAGLPGIDAISAREDLAQLRERRVRPEHLRLTAFHPMGTVRMGGDPERSVVDPFGRHHAVERLWIADASTFPTCVAVNPQMTIMAFAMRSAERLAAV